MFYKSLVEKNVDFFKGNLNLEGRFQYYSNDLVTLLRYDARCTFFHSLFLVPSATLALSQLHPFTRFFFPLDSPILLRGAISRYKKRNSERLVASSFAAAKEFFEPRSSFSTDISPHSRIRDAKKGKRYFVEKFGRCRSAFVLQRYRPASKTDIEANA